MTRILLNALLTVTAYTDTQVGLWLRSTMATPVGFFDPDLATYIVLFLHF